MSDLDAFRTALEYRRSRLPQDVTAFRWSDGEVSSSVVDLFGDVAILNLYDEHTPAHEAQLANVLAQVTSVRAVYVKRRPREAHSDSTKQAAYVAPTEPLFGTPVQTVTILEHGLKFEIRPANGLSVGLYLDARDARRRVAAASNGKQVLNLFSYTCGFGVAALSGGATRAVNVDVSRKVLDWGEANVALNGFGVNRRDFIAGDAFDWLARFKKKGEVFDLVVLDPPGFATTEHSRFSAQRDLYRLVEAAVGVVSKEGRMLAVCNVAAMSQRDVEQHIRRGCGTRRFTILERFGASAVDCRQPSPLKCFLIQLLP